MTKRGSNDRKAKARRIAKERDVRVTEAHSLLLQAKNRNDPRPSDASAGETAYSSGEAHELRIHRTAADGTVEVLDGDAAAHAVWQASPGALTAGCRCGWVNPHAGPRFPDLPAPYGVEPNEQKHWRWYQLAAWAEHAGDMEGEPSSAEYVQDPSVTINDLTIQVIFDLRLLLHHAQDDRETVAATYEAMETLLRTARIRIAHERARPGSGRQPDAGQPDQEEPSVSEEIPVSLDVLLRRTNSGRSGGYWELLAVEFAAAELRRLVLQESQHAVSTVPDAPV
ncbi:hypothetical protein F7Q99_35685 [Streptomyces kaniharaensis]|uniref:Uncharacterized protein n=1 Tax=Streptomyces kaniharaensis TaxID=212423 RepID=A0A6N7L4Z1_9ACTN|nr:hypothetical protein [Streptomyces kaniharaensis]MQS17384.1 hypothetical protein [Streptomyces kaniharaensis]